MTIKTDFLQDFAGYDVTVGEITRYNSGALQYWNGAAWVSISTSGGASVGLDAAKPALGTTGALYYATDTDRGYIWDGSAWAPYNYAIAVASGGSPTSPTIGQLWYDTTQTVAHSRLKVWTGTAWEFVSVTGGPTVTGGTLTSAYPFTGAGTSGSPWVITVSGLASGQVGVKIAEYTVTGLRPLQFVPIFDSNSSTNGGRFTFTSYMADATGKLNFSIIFSDSPASAGGTSYSAAVQVGLASIYITANSGALSSTFPQSVNWPTGLTAATTSWTAANDTLTPSGCVSLSKDGTTYVSSPATLSITTGDTLYTKWLGNQGSGTCIDSANGTTITGTITASGGEANSVSLVVDKTPTPVLTFTNTTGQALSSVTQSGSVTVNGINSYAYVTGSIATGTNLQASIAGGAWTAVPASGTTMYVSNGQTIEFRLTNSGTNNITSTATINVGSQTGITWTSTTITAGAAVVTPTITAPVGGATGISTTPTLTSSAFSSSGGAGTHATSDWEIASDAAFTTIVASSIASATNKTSWTVTTALSASTLYYARVRYTSTATVTTSSNSPTVSFTTVALPGVNWTALPAPASWINARDVVWSPAQSKYVAVGINATFVNVGMAATSTNGTSWTVQSSLESLYGTPDGFYSIAWSPSLSKYIAVGWSGTASSADGVTWTDEPGLTPINYSVEWNGTHFVAVGAGGKCARSTDGINWANITSLNTALGGSAAYSIVWSGTQFVVVGSNAQCATSPTGVTWTNQSGLATAVGTTTMYSVAWSGTQFVAVGLSGKCATSPDGVTWTNQPGLATAVGAGYMTCVAWCNNQFVVVGSNAQCATSPDGVTWTNQPGLATAVASTGMYSVIWNGTQLVAVGDSGRSAISV